LKVPVIVVFPAKPKKTFEPTWKANGEPPISKLVVALTTAPVTFPLALTFELALTFVPERFPVAVTFPPALMLVPALTVPPEILPVALTFAPEMFPVVLMLPPETFPPALTFLPALTFPPALRFWVAVSLPATLIVDPDCLMIESSTFAAPPLLANTGMLPFLQAEPEEHVMGLAGGA
jgi:hypothetical protein